MRLALRFTLAFLIAMSCVLLVHGYFVYRREVGTFENDMRREQRTLGRVMALTVHALWQIGGPAAALDLVSKANRVEASDRLLLTWTWLDGNEGAAYRHSLSADQLAQLERGYEVTWFGHRRDPAGRLCTLIPVRTPEGRLGGIEIRESWAEVPAYVRQTVHRKLVAAAAIAVISALLSIVLGFHLVGRPVRLLIDHARRIARGEFTSRVRFRHRDELGQLAGELNAMSGQLESARERLLQETSQKILAVEQLRHADRLTTVGQLASGVAHELGTPLNVVWARAKMIASGQVTSKDIPGNARIIAEQSERMTRIIRGLLDFARPRAPKKIVTDLRQVAARTATLLQSLADKRSVTMQVDRGEEPLFAEVDPSQLEQVLSNLVLNGIQAMHRPGRLTISLAKERTKPPADHGGAEDDYLCISVTDEGEGIPDEIMRHLFEPFFTTKQIGEGTGLGLSVSRGIVTEHGGWISVTSRPGEGSRFSVYLPRRSDDAGQRADR
jgi:two-component system NtrC family sensor kinase